MRKTTIVALRHDQDAKSIAAAIDPNVTVYAPDWMKVALDEISAKLQGATFTVCSSKPGQKGRIYKPIEQIKEIEIKGPLTLQQLQMIARNEASNTSGTIAYGLYQMPPFSRELIHAIKDLVKQCVIVGCDTVKSYGGYGSQIKPQSEQKVYICDSIGLQFQSLVNSGRLVVIRSPEKEAKDTISSKGTLDDFIFEKVVGEQPKSYDEASKDATGRFLKVKWKGEAVLFDTLAYKKFVIQDFILAATSLNEAAAANNDLLNFKFLAVGTGCFASDFKDYLFPSLTQAVKEALEILLSKPGSIPQIKRLELPFYPASKTLDQIKDLCLKNDIEFSATKEDALKQTSTRYVTATTNCADPHVVLGNERYHQSVDASIVEHLSRRGHNFNSVLNSSIKAKYVSLDKYFSLELPKEKEVKEKEEKGKPETVVKALEEKADSPKAELPKAEPPIEEAKEKDSTLKKEAKEEEKNKPKEAIKKDLAKKAELPTEETKDEGPKVKIVKEKEKEKTGEERGEPKETKGKAPKLEKEQVKAETKEEKKAEEEKKQVERLSKIKKIVYEDSPASFFGYPLFTLTVDEKKRRIFKELSESKDFDTTVTNLCLDKKISLKCAFQLLELSKHSTKTISLDSLKQTKQLYDKSKTSLGKLLRCSQTMKDVDLLIEITNKTDQEGTSYSQIAVSKEGLSLILKRRDARSKYFIKEKSAEKTEEKAEEKPKKGAVVRVLNPKYSGNGSYFRGGSGLQTTTLFKVYEDKQKPRVGLSSTEQALLELQDKLKAKL